jgi:hypothetical protein
MMLTLTDDGRLHASVIEALKVAGCIVIVDGEMMVQRDVLRNLMRAFVTELCDHLIAGLTPLVAGNPDAEEKLPTAVEEMARRLEHQIAEIVLVIN